MTKDTESQPHKPTPEEEALLAVLDGADPFTEGGAPGAKRADLEALGLMAQAATPMIGFSRATRAAAKVALFNRLDLPMGQTSGVGSTPETVLPFLKPQSTPVRQSNLVPLALAAAVLLAVGLGAWSGFLMSELKQSRTLVAGLESELDERANQIEVGIGPNDFQQVLFENRRLRHQIGVATKPNTRVCALSAVAADQPMATGAVFLRPDEHVWVIATNNLAKCELGRRYRLWFLGEDGSVMGGELLEHVNGETEFEIASGELPDGASAVLVTLEFPDQFGEQPGGARVLYGERSVEIY